MRTEEQEADYRELLYVVGHSIRTDPRNRRPVFDGEADNSFAGVVRSLASIAHGYRVNSHEALCLVGYSFHYHPNFQGDFLTAARVASEAFAALDDSHPLRKQFKIERVEEGYSLLASGKVPLVKGQLRTS